MNLFTPGPVNVSRAAREGLQASGMHHRSDDFRRVIGEISSHLQAAFLTTGDVVTLTSSGTGAMEAAVAGLLSPGDTVLIPVSGKFSRRWAEICEAHGAKAESMEIAPGEAPEADAVVSTLEADPAISAVLLTHCETSTGSLTDLKTICSAVHDLEHRKGREVLIIADCITSLYVDELRVDDWGIDCAVAASQKGLLSFPGLAFVSPGERALARLESATSSAYYFDLRKYLNSETPFTPAIPLVEATLASLRYLRKLGLESVWHANRSGALALKLLIQAAGMKPVARRQASGVVAFWTGEMDPERIAGTLEEDHDIIIARGQRDLKGRILRVSPIGKGPGELRRFADAFTNVIESMGRPLGMDAIEPEFNRLLEDCAIWG